MSELAGVAGDVRAHLREAGVEERERYAVDLALEELVGNTIRHGYEGRDEHEIRIRVDLSEDEIRVAIEDDARAFDPTRMPEPPRPTSLADTPTGGRGILMVRRMIADMRYARVPGRNTLTLVVPREQSGHDGRGSNSS